MKTGKRVLSLLLVAALLLSTSVAVFAETVLAIDIATLPAKLTYTEWEALDVTGGELTVYYSGSQEVIPITEDMVTGFDSNVLGTQTLTVSYAGAVCTYDVLITPKPASAISVTTLPAKLTYLEGKDTLDVTGGKLTVSYTDGTPDKIISMTLDMVTGFDNTIVGTQTLTVTYAEQTTTFQVEIQAKTLTKLVLAQTPTKTKYLLGEEVLDITGGQIRLIYNNDTSELVDMTADMVSGFDGNTAGVQTITVSYGGLTTTYQIEVLATDVISISVAKLPDVTKYLLDIDDVDVTGGEITVKYYNNTTATIPMTAEMVSGFDNTVLGKRTLTVTYEEKTTTFTVEICQNNTTEFFSGLGTVKRPYVIKTKEHLNHVRNYLDAHYMMIADIEFTEADFAEDGAFYNSGEGWQPIGTSSAPFSGYFDGNGHTIKGLQIYISGNSSVYAGLFGYVQYGTIWNLGMVDSCIEVTSTSNSSFYDAYAYAGGIVGYAYSSTITDCYNTGSVTAAATSSYCDANAGGIVGFATTGSTITDCYNTGSVTATATSTSSSSSAYADAGGIVGHAYEGTTITDCYNMGSVTAKTTSRYYYDANAGGIVGDAFSSTITDCYNTGSISASDYAGGIVGRAYSSTTITNCYYLNINGMGVGIGTDTATARTDEQMKQRATYAGFDFETVWTMDPAGEYPLPTLRSVAHVESEEDTVNFAGGNGSIANPYQIATKEHLNNVRNHPGFFFELVADIAFTEADFAEDGAFYNDGIGWQPIGTYSAPFNGYFDGNGHTIKGLQINIFGSSPVYAGLFGDVKNCTIRNLGMVDSCIEGTSTSDYTYAYAGGIVGYAYSNTTITDCYNTGSVTAKTTSGIPNAQANAGGIVGYAYSGIITNCYNVGSVSASDYAGGIVGYADSTITDCYNTGSISSSNDAGGIVGCAQNINTITDCYNTGSVSASDHAGGIVGYADSISTITNCYNTGSVTATSVSFIAPVGGIVGYAYSSSTITNCYYLNIIGKGVGRGTDTATACTVKQMKQQETFAGFDFDTVWTMEGHEDFLFPELQTVPMVFTDSVVDISIETLPDKLTFEEGIPLDTSGGMLKVSYLGGKVIEVPLEVSMVTGFDNSAPGEQILTVTYEGKTTTYTVTVTHSFGDWAVTEKPTCTEKGEETRTCATCGKTETREVEALGHDYKATVTDPTCTEQGYTTHTCSRCDDSYVDTYVEAMSHDFGEWTETKAATCTEKGEERRDCSRCKHYETREVEVLGHDYKDAATDPTCTEQGYTTHTCSRCSDSYVDTYVEALGHDLGAWAETKAATCTEKGAERRDCSRCEYYETREVEALGHDYKATVTDPTCTEQGYTTHTCTRCGDSYVDTYVDALGHDFGEWTETKAATCTEKGEECRDCSRCGHYETREVEALGHDYEATVTDPTCTEQGYTTHTCSRCDDSYVDTYVDALGHDLGEWAETKAATCTEKGAERRDCSRCEYYETREVEALGHDYKATVTDPTCTEQGYTTHTCTRCNDSYADSYADALGHRFGQWVSNGDATEEKDGTKTRTCSVCGFTETETDVGSMLPATPWVNPYTDVKESAWYYDSVSFATNRGLFNGTSATTFGPNDEMTRAMFVTVLYRLDGSPAIDGGTHFTDIFVDAYYYDAVKWANANGIVYGTDADKFSPDASVTREQMVTFLYRYANYKGVDTGYEASLAAFTDANSVSDYALHAMAWSVGADVIHGSDGMLLPGGTATRAEVATMLKNYVLCVIEK